MNRLQSWQAFLPLFFVALLIFLWTCLIYIGCDRMEPQPVIVMSIDETPSVSPDGNWIVYRHEDFDQDPIYPSGLYIIDVNGQNRCLLLEGYALSPDWSPASEQIAFSADDIFTISASGDSIWQVTDIGHCFFPSWSPDGSKLAFDTNYNDPRGSNVVWIVNVDGTNLTDISIHGTGEWRDPDWSSNGQKIVYIRGADDGTDWEIFVMDTSGNNAQRLTFNSISDHNPAWSPDGMMIAWYNDKGEIWLMNADGSNQRRLTDGVYPAWSPDSRKIYFSWQSPRDDKRVLYSIGVDGLELTQLTF